MLDFLRSTAAIVFVFGVVIFVHELGHFLAAKITGVYAPRFSIGFGKALWSRKWGETEYILAAIPLGGYVRLASRQDEALQMLEGGGEEPAADPQAVASGEAHRPRYYDPNGMAPFGPKPVPENRWFESKPLPARLLIMTAGVAMNVILGFAIFTGLNLWLGRPVLHTRTIGAIEAPANAPQLTAGLAAGDTIVMVDDSAVHTWNDIARLLLGDSTNEVRIGTQRGEVRLPVGGAGQPTRLDVYSAIQPDLPPVLERTISGMPAARGGLRGGDRIVSVDGEPVRTWGQVVVRIERAPGRDLRFGVRRKDSSLTLVVRPDSARVAIDASGRDTVVGKIGAERAQVNEREPIGFGEALREGASETGDAASAVVAALRRLAADPRTVRDFSSPIGIGEMTARQARFGVAPLLELLAAISINLAIFNLLPIPILDGGQILITIAESLKGSALSLRTREYLMRFGLAAIALLFVIVMYNDITRLLRRIVRL